MLNKLRTRWWFWVAITLAAMTLLVAFLRKLLPFPRTIVAQHKKPGETLVILFGDSITEGLMSHSYVDLLAQRMGHEGYRFMNAGIGGDTAYNLLNRVGPVVESQPDAVVILVGTNDLQAYLRGGYLPAFMQRIKKLPRALTLDWYISTVRKLVQAVQHDTPAQVALCSIPILGEDLDSRPNEAVRLFNRALNALADDLNVAYIPVYETMEVVLRTQHHGPGKAFEESSAGGIMLAAMWEHTIRGRSWDDIAARHGLVLTTDLIHFNRRGAEIISGVIEGWLRQRT